MATISIINENGEVVDRKITSRNITIVKDADINTKNGVTSIDSVDSIEPAVVQRLKYDDEGKQSQTTTVCGETENRREADRGVDFTVEGILVKDQLEDIKNLKQFGEFTLVSDIETNTFIVKRTTIEQNTEIIHFTPNGGTQQLAFPFQLQLKYPES